MSKQVQWSPGVNYLGSEHPGAIRKGPSFKEAFAGAQIREEAQAQADRRWQILKPYLKKSLREAIQNGEEIEIRRPIAYFTETLTVAKSADPTGNGGSAKANTVKKMIPRGSKIVCKSWLPALKQFIFENVQNGDEYEIYPYEMLHTGNPQSPVMPNSAWLGLLQNTNIYDDLMEKLSEED